MIESVNNEKIKRYSKLNEKKYRDKENMFIVEGEHLVEEALEKGIVIDIFSLEEKENQWLLCSGNDIIWDVGKRADNRYKVTSATKIVLIVKKK